MDNPFSDLPLFTIAHLARKQAAKSRRGRAAKANAALPPAWQAVSPMQRRGQYAEIKAARWLQQQKLTILTTNLRCKFGEIDIVAKEHGILVFIEVRSRSHQRFGGAAASIDHAKQKRIIRTAQYHLLPLAKQFFNNKIPPCRFDVVTLQQDRLKWYRAAFSMRQ